MGASYLLQRTIPVEKAPARSPEPVSAPKRPVPCFFLGSPRRREERACVAFGGVRLVRWETECQPDPSCTKFPDGTDWAKP